MAIEVQRSFLPKESPKIEGYGFFEYYQPANHVGGDYYDYIRLKDGRLAVIVADVVGHGVAAALLVAKLSAESRFALASESDAALEIAPQLGISPALTVVPIVAFLADVGRLMNA